MIDVDAEDAAETAKWCLEDPRQTQADNPYTFFVPSDAEKAALENGDIVKLIFEGMDCGGEAAFERMWVIFDGKDENGLHGILDNHPFYIEGLSQGDKICFHDFHIIDLVDPKFGFSEGQDKYFSRCHVDQSILDGTASVHRLERRKPKFVWWWHRKHEIYPDTGWYIFAKSGAGQNRRKMQKLAIGVVLNKDDSFLDCIELPVGSTLVKGGVGFRLI